MKNVSSVSKTELKNVEIPSVTTYLKASRKVCNLLLNLLELLASKGYVL